MAEPANKRRRVEPKAAPSNPVSAFAAAKARLQAKSPSNIVQVDGILPGSTESDVERLSDDGYESGGSGPDEPVSADAPLSSWVATAQNLVQESPIRVIIRLAKDETLCITGQYHMQVRRGAVVVAAARIPAGTRHCFVVAPAIEAVPVIRCCSEEGAWIELGAQEAIERDLNCLESFSPSFLNVGDPSHPRDGVLTRRWSFAINRKASDDPLGRPLRPLEIPSKWSDALNIINVVRSRTKRPTIVAAIGTRAAGKTLVSQAIVNNCLDSPYKIANHVFLIDLDPDGQSYNLDGQISASRLSERFVGPPFATALGREDGEFAMTIRAHAFPQFLHQKDEHHMMECARDLLSACLKHAAAYEDEEPMSPLIVVKFPDLSQGHGSAMTLALLEALRPIKVLSVARGPPKVLADIASACQINALIPLEPLPPSAMSQVRTASEIRDMHLLASAHDRFDTATTPLAHQRPLYASYAEGREDFLAVACYPDMPPADKLGDLLSASLVSIVLLEDPDRFDLRIEREKRSGLPHVLSNFRNCTPQLHPAHSRLVGVALVRAVDTKRQILEMVPISGDAEYSKLPADRLVLVHGCFETSKAIIGEEAYYRAHRGLSTPDGSLVDDYLRSTLRHGQTPYLEQVTGEQDLKEAHWKSRKFNMGGGG